MTPVRLPGRGRNKFNAKAQIVDGVRFASQKEARRYCELKLLRDAGRIQRLELQPRFDLEVVSKTGECVKVGRFTADFAYEEWPAWQRVIEDVKSQPSKTEAYRLRKRIVEAQYGVTITEI
jgi:hypothetical protein